MNLLDTISLSNSGMASAGELILFFGVIALMIFDEIMTNCIKKGVKTNVINPVLEENKKMQLLWEDYQSREPHIRRRCFIKKID